MFSYFVLSKIVQPIMTICLCIRLYICNYQMFISSIQMKTMSCRWLWSWHVVWVFQKLISWMFHMQQAKVCTEWCKKTKHTESQWLFCGWKHLNDNRGRGKNGLAGLSCKEWCDSSHLWSAKKHIDIHLTSSLEIDGTSGIEGSVNYIWTFPVFTCSVLVVSLRFQHLADRTVTWCRLLLLLSIYLED